MSPAFYDVFADAASRELREGTRVAVKVGLEMGCSRME